VRCCQAAGERRLSRGLGLAKQDEASPAATSSSFVGAVSVPYQCAYCSRMAGRLGSVIAANAAVMTLSSLEIIARLNHVARLQFRSLGRGNIR
jgi:hypothetical protein